MFLFFFFNNFELRIFLISIRIRNFINWAIFFACACLLFFFFKEILEFMWILFSFFFLSIHSDLFRFLDFVRILLFFQKKGRRRIFFGGYLLFLFSPPLFESCFYFYICF
uniref:Hypothetical chloroplast RF1 n=1 Tax=Handeliodendron bodinieri TaxID=290952 RepID=A0A7S8FIK4_9ROSI|nr:hypothetical chloroplast RF1 [Handeliodendron bodinieri]QPD06631.1 hypothetical chloroplast RF1 [Handeliodendron bodinieri]